VAASRLGKNLSPEIIGHLVDLAIQGTVIDFIAEHSTALADVGDARLTYILTDIDLDESLQRSLRLEADIVDSLANRGVPMSPEEVAREMEQMPAGSNGTVASDC
jgi:hypothetical protein